MSDEERTWADIVHELARKPVFDRDSSYKTSHQLRLTETFERLSLPHRHEDEQAQRAAVTRARNRVTKQG